MSANPIIGNRYELQNVLGSGGMGKVYKALDLETNQHIALKLIELPVNRGDQLRKRFLSEVSALSKLDHPSIVKLLDFGVEGSMAYIAMDLIDGKSLSRTGDYSKLINLVHQVSEALTAVHARNIIHRDIKPDNILVVEGEEPKAILVDFGVAKQTESNLKLTSTGTIVGTINYMSPEQVMGVQIDARSDLYSLGCVMYEALTGALPFDFEDVTTQISSILSERPRKPSLHDPSIPPALEVVVMRLLEKNPDRRYANALELSDVLENILSKSDFGAKTPVIIQTKSNPFVGRSAQLKHFEKALNNAFSGNGAILCVCGAQGVGKSRLMLEWQSMALAKGARFIIVDTGSPKPLSNLLDQVVGYVTPEMASNSWIIENASFLAGVSQKIAEKFPTINQRIEEVEQTRLVIAARNFIEAVFENQTVVIAQDEVKDSVSTAVLKKLSKNISSKKLIIIDVTVSPSDSAFGAVVSQENSLSLEMFTIEEVSTLARLMHGKPLGYESVEKIFNASAGNPLYVVELLTDVGKGSTTIEMVPSTLRQLFRDKMKNLSSQSKLLLEKMSILKRSMPLGDLQPIVRMGDDSFTASFMELLSRGLVIERYSAGQMDIGITSPIIGQILVEDTTNNELVRAYSELAMSLEIISAGRTTIYDGQIGEFYLMSGQVDKGVRYLFSSIKRLSDANDEAALHKEILKVEPVISQIADPWLKAKVTIQALASKTMQGDIEGVNHYIGLLSKMFDNGQMPHELVAESYLEMALAFLETEQMEDAARVIEQVKSKVSQEQLDNNLKYWKILSQLYIRQDKPKLAEKPANMVVMLSYKNSKKKDVANAISYQAVVACLNEKFDVAAELLEQVRQIGSDTNDLRIELRALNNLAGVYFESDRFLEAEEVLNQAVVVSEKLELTNSTIENLFRLVLIMEWKGDFNGKRIVLSRINQLLDENPSSQFMSEYLSHIIRMSLYDTDFVTASRQIDELIELAMKTNRPLLIRTAMIEKTYLYYYQGQLEKALRECEKLDELFVCAKSEDVLINNYLNCFLASRIHARLGNIRSSEQFLEKGRNLLATFPEATKDHHYECDLARFWLEWAKIKQGNGRSRLTLGITRKAEKPDHTELLKQIKPILEHVDAPLLARNRQVLEILVLFMDIVIWLFNAKVGNNKEDLNELTALASNCTETCIKYFSSSGTNLFREEILMKNNELVQQKRKT